MSAAMSVAAHGAGAGDVERITEQANPRHQHRMVAGALNGLAAVLQVVGERHSLRAEDPVHPAQALGPTDSAVAATAGGHHGRTTGQAAEVVVPLIHVTGDEHRCVCLADQLVGEGDLDVDGTGPEPLLAGEAARVRGIVEVREPRLQPGGPIAQPDVGHLPSIAVEVRDGHRARLDRHPTVPPPADRVLAVRSTHRGAGEDLQVLVPARMASWLLCSSWNPTTSAPWRP